MSILSWIRSSCVAVACVGCASSPSSNGPSPSGPDASQEDASEGEGGAATASNDAGTLEGGTLIQDAGAASCGNPLDMHGCACTPGTAPRSCYPGPASQAGVGACTKGRQTCVTTQQGEITTGEWGPCEGSGTPTTCAIAGAQCGSLSDGCAGVLDCGACSDGATCGGGGAPNVCGAGTCPPTTCAAQGATCGSLADGCGNTLDCGSCPTGQTCGGGGAPNQCGCTPTTCAAQGATCGSLADGCGSTLDCGSCPTGQTCGGGGAPNQCGGGTSNCGPLQQYNWTADVYPTYPQEGMNMDPTQCQAFCNGFAGVLCCVLEGTACFPLTDTNCLASWETGDAGFVGPEDWAAKCN